MCKFVSWKYVSVGLTVFVFSLMGCSHEKKDSLSVLSDVNKVTPIISDMVITMNEDVNNLPLYMDNSYYLTNEGDTCILAYNYKSHNLDRLNLSKNICEESIQLFRDGPNGIDGELCWLFCNGEDSIFLFDEQKLYLLDSEGTVRKSFGIGGDYRPIVARNGRMHTASMKYDRGKNSVVFSVITEKDEMRLMSVNIDNGEITDLRSLPGFTGKKMGFMIYPNISFTDSLVIYNFAYEPKIMFGRIYDKEDFREVDSRMALMRSECEECAPNPDALSWHGFANPHYCEVIPINEGEVYLQVVIGPTRGTRENMEDAYLNRPLYLRAFDKEMNATGEIELAENTYHPYEAWVGLPDGMVIFKDNSLNPENDYETVRVSKISL